MPPLLYPGMVARQQNFRNGKAAKDFRSCVVRVLEQALNVTLFIE
jgi:hypothetical protein